MICKIRTKKKKKINYHGYWIEVIVLTILNAQQSAHTESSLGLQWSRNSQESFNKLVVIDCSQWNHISGCAKRHLSTRDKYIKIGNRAAALKWTWNLQEDLSDRRSFGSGQCSLSLSWKRQSQKALKYSHEWKSLIEGKKPLNVDMIKTWSWFLPWNILLTLVLLHELIWHTR